MRTVILVLLVWGTPLFIRAACNPKFTGTTSNTFVSGTNPIAFTFSVKRNGAAPCSYFVTFGKGGSGTYTRKLYFGLNEYLYNIYDSLSLTNILKDLPEATASEVIVSNFLVGGGNTNSHTYYGNRPTQSLSPAGSYTDSVVFRLFEGTFGSATTPNDSVTYTYSYTVSTQVNLSLVDTGAPFDLSDASQNLNFGSLETSESQAFDVVIESNTGYILKMSSSQNQKLKHSSLAETINYSLSVKGVNQNLSTSSGSPVTVASGTGFNPSGGFRLPVSVTIGNVANKMAGNYEDTVTITVQAN